MADFCMAYSFQGVLISTLPSLSEFCPGSDGVIIDFVRKFLPIDSMSCCLAGDCRCVIESRVKGGGGRRIMVIDGCVRCGC